MLEFVILEMLIANWPSHPHFVYHYSSLLIHVPTELACTWMRLLRIDPLISLLEESTSMDYECTLLLHRDVQWFAKRLHMQVVYSNS